MAYAVLRDRAEEMDRVLLSRGAEPMAADALDRELGFIYESEDEAPVATIYELKQFVEHWNAKL